MKIREADKLEVTVLVDNYTDLLLENQMNVSRPKVSLPNVPLAEHGFSCFIKIFAGSEEHFILFDAGLSEKCLVNNAEVLKVDLSKIEAVVLSHGHADHFGGLIELLKKAPKNISVIMHPDALLNRRLNLPSSESKIDVPHLDENLLRQSGAEVIKNKNASTLCNDLVLVLGQIPRSTNFEKNLPWTEALINDEWVVDPFNDDQGLAVKIKGKGIVVIGGCSHAGIINTIKHAQYLTGEEKVDSVLGGFHLSGKMFEPIVEPTIKEMKKIDPKYVIPMHCTGWKASTQIEQAMPEQFILNSVGTTYTF